MPTGQGVAAEVGRAGIPVVAGLVGLARDVAGAAVAELDVRAVTGPIPARVHDALGAHGLAGGHAAVVLRERHALGVRDAGVEAGVQRAEARRRLRSRRFDADERLLALAVGAASDETTEEKIGQGGHGHRDLRTHGKELLLALEPPNYVSRGCLQGKRMATPRQPTR